MSSFVVKSWRRRKMNKCKFFWPPNILGETTPTFLLHIVSAMYCPPFRKVWMGSACWPPSAKPGNEVEYWIYRGWVKLPKFVDILRRCMRPLVVSNALARLCISYLISKIQAVVKSLNKGGFGPQILGGISQSLHMHFQITLTSEHVASFGWVLFELGG